ncbi:antibiotic biosynthesis monooxygenase [Streptomyces sp. NBC_01476]|uniref:putative quinol monooxygenase n=1 Tax=Streptomyces sp. NBC_01476 TaxID=2903881 RepID=UPI002E36D821|nr:putative quinol monooxygenase [Streptomyces sp. NBC_01476]
MPEFLVIAHHTIAADQDVDEVLAVYPKLAAATRAEPGNVSFAVFRQLDDDRELVILERYVSRDAAEAHLRTPHFKEFVLTRLVPRLENRWSEKYDVPE